MDKLILPGCATEEESVAALRRTSPDVALISLMAHASAAEFVCIGRDADGEAMACVVPAEEFLAWFETRGARRRRPV